MTASAAEPPGKVGPSADPEPRELLVGSRFPADRVDAANRRDNAGRAGHPSKLGVWWSRKRYPGVRATVFAALVDDRDREAAVCARLADPTLDLGADPTGVLAEARRLLARRWPEGPPLVVDPFAGRGTTGLEAARLGLPVVLGDLNPLAALICRATVELPARLGGRSPDPGDPRLGVSPTGPLAGELERWGQVVFDRTRRDTGWLWPSVQVDGRPAEPVAVWWVRTVPHPDPAVSVPVPVTHTWVLTKAQRKHPAVWVEPRAEPDGTLRFEVHTGPEPPPGTTRGTRLAHRGVVCPFTGQQIPEADLRRLFTQGRAGAVPAVLIVDPPTGGGYRYLPVPPGWRSAPPGAPDLDGLDTPLSGPRNKITPPLWGLGTVGDLFNPTQAHQLAVFARTIAALHPEITADAATRGGLGDDPRPLRDGGTGPRAWADAVCTLLGLVLARTVTTTSTLCGWKSGEAGVRDGFPSPAMRMTWDFIETNPHNRRTSGWKTHLGTAVEAVRTTGRSVPPGADVTVVCAEARSTLNHPRIRTHPGAVHIHTDPPYGNQIPYSRLSEVFHPWLRAALTVGDGPVWPAELDRPSVPKAPEIVMQDTTAAERDRFRSRMRDVFSLITRTATAAPVTVWYADSGATLIGFLDALATAGLHLDTILAITTEDARRLRTRGNNAKQTSLVLVGHPRPEGRTTTLADALRAARTDLDRHTGRIRGLTGGDRQQYLFGLAVSHHSRWDRIVRPTTGEPVPLEEFVNLLVTSSGDRTARHDPGTRWALGVFQDKGFAAPVDWDDAEWRATEAGADLRTDVIDTGIVSPPGAGDRRVRLAHWDHPTWDTPPPRAGEPLWCSLMRLTRALTGGGLPAAAQVLARVPDPTRLRELCDLAAEIAHDAARAEPARVWRELLADWDHIERATRAPTQPTLPGT